MHITHRLAACAVLAAALLASPAPVRAEDLTPVGRWTTVDDSTHKAKSVVRIWEEDGKLLGKIESLILEPGEDPAPKCDKCEGERKDQPVIGMVILWGLTRDGKEWSGGKILDPDDGKTYRCWVEPIEGGAKLKVHGYIGISLLGRTQLWLKAD